MKTIAVIGGGAAGLMAAVTAAKAGAKVMVLEHQPSCGKKTAGHWKRTVQSDQYPDEARRLPKPDPSDSEESSTPFFGRRYPVFFFRHGTVYQGAEWLGIPL